MIKKTKFACATAKQIMTNSVKCYQRNLEEISAEMTEMRND